MTRLRTWTRRSAGLLVLTLLMAACGAATESAPTTTEPPAPASTTTTTMRPENIGIEAPAMPVVALPDLSMVSEVEDQLADRLHRDSEDSMTLDITDSWSP